MHINAQVISITDIDTFTVITYIIIRKYISARRAKKDKSIE